MAKPKKSKTTTARPQAKRTAAPRSEALAPDVLARIADEPVPPRTVIPTHLVLRESA